MAEDSLESALGIPQDVDLDLDQVEEGSAATWPEQLEQAFQNLRQVKSERVVNARNLGDLAFTGADQQLADMVEILSDLRLEEWRLIRDELANQIVAQATGLLDTMREMAELRSSQSDVQGLRNQLQQRFDAHYRFFIDHVRPLCVTARVVEVLRERRDLLPGDLSEERIDELQTTFQKLSEDVEEFKSLSDLVTAQRQLLSTEAASDLSQHFKALGEQSKTR